MKNAGIYVHIPFCKSKCGYCDFNSFAGMEMAVGPYFSALNEEISTVASNNTIAADTIYFGGGTPTCVDLKYIEKTLELLFLKCKISAASEITVECNPGTIDLAGLKRLKACGFNRLSIGLQSTNDALLKVLGRIHTVRDFEDCLENARIAGFNNISLDLMYGLPDQTLSLWEETLETALGYETEHISCYALKIEENTPFAHQKLLLPQDDEVADMYDLCVEKLKGNRYFRYEISNFAKENHVSLHNMKYWRCHDFWGFGAGAFSCIKNKRFSNCCSPSEYIEKINSSHSAILSSQNLTKTDLMSEFVFLGLRCSDGISISEFNKRFNSDIFEIFESPLQKYISMGFLKHSDDRIFFADNAFFVSNTILSDFI